jgi:apolipoprotein N-acyltransferase
VRAIVMKRLRPWALAFLSGVFTFAGFAGFDLWPLAFIAFTPLLFAIDEFSARGKGAFGLSLFFGFVTSWGGYYWLVPTLEAFSGFPVVICVLIASILLLYTGGCFAIFGWLYARLVSRGLSPTWSVVVSLLVCEWLYPLLFPFHYGAAFHGVPVFLQVAELGGALAVTAITAMTSGAVYEVLRARLRREPMPRVGPLSAAAYVLFVLGFGAFSLARGVEAPIALRVGVVQTNMELFAKRYDVDEGDRRHREQSAELERTDHPDLIVWPESAFAHFLGDRVDDVSEIVFGPGMNTPLLFGTLQARFTNGDMTYHNTALLADGRGRVLGSYDKTFLLAFSEYMPFGDVFPILHEWSPNSGRFSPGEHVRALPLEHDGRTLRLGTIICYEDVLPSFVRKMVRESRPHALINITNDAWFGDTTEPWIHLALAQLRAVEHRVPLVRATNSGVSAFVDAMGRVTRRTDTFVRASVSETIHVAEEPPVTLYALLGPWPGYASLLVVVFFGFVRRRKG